MWQSITSWPAVTVTVSFLLALGVLWLLNDLLHCEFAGDSRPKELVEPNQTSRSPPLMPAGTALMRENAQADGACKRKHAP